MVQLYCTERRTTTHWSYWRKSTCTTWMQRNDSWRWTRWELGPLSVYWCTWIIQVCCNLCCNSSCNLLLFTVEHLPFNRCPFSPCWTTQTSSATMTVSRKMEFSWLRLSMLMEGKPFSNYWPCLHYNSTIYSVLPSRIDQKVLTTCIFIP